MNLDVDLETLVREVDVRVDRGHGLYAGEKPEVRRAVDLARRLVDDLGLVDYTGRLGRSSGKPQALLRFGTPTGDVVLKVYGRHRPAEAAVQRAWFDAGLPVPEILGHGDAPATWLLMRYIPGSTPAEASLSVDVGRRLTISLARTMKAAHDVGAPRIGGRVETNVAGHLSTVLRALRRHGYDVARDRERAALDVLASGDEAVVHGDLAPGNLIVTPSGEVYLIDACGYLGDRGFDAVRWSARVGGVDHASSVLETWLSVEDACDGTLARSMLGVELLMEAGVREIVKVEQGRPTAGRDPTTAALLAASLDLLPRAPSGSVRFPAGDGVAPAARRSAP